MNTKIVKKTVEEYAKSNGISVKEFLRSNELTTDSNYLRMLKEGTFKVQFIEKIADVIGISIDELIGRTTLKRIAKNDNLLLKAEYEKIIEQKDDIILKQESTISDKLKIISLLEKQLQHYEAKRK